MTAPAKPVKNPPFVDPATFTPQFEWKSERGGAQERVYCEGVALENAAKHFGTPAYLYSSAAIKSAYNELHRGLGALPHTLCFAVKSNGNLSILQYLAKLGSGFDVVSGGELLHLQHLGVPGDKIVFSGVGKTREEIREALKYPPAKKGGASGILLFNTESEAELEVLLDESAKLVSKGAAAPSVSIRVNPDVQAGGHPHISTGRYEHKFGLDWPSAHALYRKYKTSKFIRWNGLSAHIGSQITAIQPFERALRRLAGFVQELRRDAIALQFLDFGGGLGIRYTDQTPPSRSAYAKMIARVVKPLGVKLLLEPGRTIIAPAGVLLTRVIYTKQTNGKSFVVVDAAMNDLMRPALYGATHPITAVVRNRALRAKPSAAMLHRADIVGPVCETGDCFLRNWPIGEVKPGDVLAIWAAGAYGMSQASNYNARRRPVEVLVEGNKLRLIRKRETNRDLLRGDILA